MYVFMLIGHHIILYFITKKCTVIDHLQFYYRLQYYKLVAHYPRDISPHSIHKHAQKGLQLKYHTHHARKIAEYEIFKLS
jgi:hypothetical protein